VNKIFNALRHVLKNCIVFRGNVLFVHWFNEGANFGDILNYSLISMISNKKVINIRSKYFFSSHYLVIGSILDASTNKSIVWGSGYISADKRYDAKFEEIFAVRGRLTRDIINSLGDFCPEVYGDPALLLPLFYKPIIVKKYKIGIIPHYVDTESHSFIKFVENNKDIKVINLINPNALEVVDQILECDFILSSSLHGLIVSDAYNIPNQWIKISENITGGEFKYFDYFSSVGKTDSMPIQLKDIGNIKDYVENIRYNPIKFDSEKLLLACPFYDGNLNK